MTLKKDYFENTVGKAENAGNQHFLLFSQCFLLHQRDKSSFNNVEFCRLQALSIDYIQNKPLSPVLHSSVGSVQDLKTGDHWIDPRLGQYSLRKLMIVIAIGFMISTLITVLC